MLTRRYLGATIILLVALCGILAPYLSAYDPYQTSMDILQPPGPAHWLGTDDLGRDVFTRLLHGARISLVVGTGAALVATLLGVPVGLVAGYAGGKIDLFLVQFIDLFIALPGLVMALLITAMVGASVENLAMILGFVMWPTVARLVRGQALSVREATYVEAARAVGGSATWIVTRHIWPNIMRIVAAQFAITVSFAIFTSASLSFLGLGVPPPIPDWGSMVREGFQFLALFPAMSLGPGAAVGITVLGFYLMGSSVE